MDSPMHARQILYICKKKFIIQYTNIPKELQKDLVNETLLDFIHKKGYQIKKLHYNFLNNAQLIILFQVLDLKHLAIDKKNNSKNIFVQLF